MIIQITTLNFNQKDKIKTKQVPIRSQNQDKSLLKEDFNLFQLEITMMLQLLKF